MPRTYVVTGAGSGIGLALTERLVARGERVIGVDIRNAELIGDLADPVERDAVIDRIRELSGGVVDGVAAVAGMRAGTPRGVAVNYFGTVRVLDGLRPQLARSPAPRVAAVASMAALGEVDPELFAALEAGDEAAATARAVDLVGEDSENGLLYASSKRAVITWVRRYAAVPEWAGAGIAVNAIAPGVVDTPMMADAMGTSEGRAILAEVLPSPLNGPAPASAPAALLDWLLSAENSHVTGQVVFIDGGAESIARAPSF